MNNLMDIKINTFRNKNNKLNVRVTVKYKFNNYSDIEYCHPDDAIKILKILPVCVYGRTKIDDIEEMIEELKEEGRKLNKLYE